MGFFRLHGLWLAAFLCVSAHAEPRLTADELSQLAGETSQYVSEIRTAREIAAEHGLRLATYGGTSRELISFVRRQVKKLGSVESYRAWLKEQPYIHLLDWHKLQSDMDLMLLPIEGKHVEDRVLSEVYARLHRELPGNVFFKTVDINFAPDFFRKFPPGAEHFEAVSNLPITERGVERIDELNVRVGGVERNLAQWGLEQYANERFEFALANDFKITTRRTDTYGNLRQYLRFLRYLSEDPTMSQTKESEAAIRELYDHLMQWHADEVKQLLSSGDRGLSQGRTKADSKGEKIIEALEKLQLYSKDSLRTRKILDDYGMVKLARDAGIAPTRIFEPLPEGSARGNESGGKRLGQEIVVYHRTSLSAAQNISQGALWMSNNRSIINGRTTAAALGEGLYAAPGTASLDYGDTYVAITLSADAIEGVHYKRDGNWFVLLNRGAIAVDEKTKAYKIQEITKEAIVIDLMRKLETGSDERERRSTLRALATILSPESNADDDAIFGRLLHMAERNGDKPEFLRAFLMKRNAFQRVFGGGSGFQNFMQREALQLLRGKGDENEMFRFEAARQAIQGFEENRRFGMLQEWFLRDFLESAARGSYSERSFLAHEAFNSKLFRDALPPHHRAQIFWEATRGDKYMLKNYPWSLKDPMDIEILRRMYEERRRSGRDEAWESAAKHIVHEDLSTFLRAFGPEALPEKDYILFLLTDADGNVHFDKTERRSPEYIADLAHLAAHNKNEGEPDLSGMDRQILDYYFAKGQQFALLALYGAGGGLGKYLLSRFKADDRASLVMEMLNIHDGEEFGPALKKLRAAIAADPKWRASLHDAMLRDGDIRRRWGAFPWNIHDAADQGALKRILRDLRNPGDIMDYAKKLPPDEAAPFLALVFEARPVDPAPRRPSLPGLCTPDDFSRFRH